MSMTNTEAVILCRYAKACCPQQQFDEFTPDAWWDLLNDLQFAACKTALAQVAKRKPFVSPAEIREEVTRVRRDRIRDGEHLIGENWPSEFSDLAMHAWNREVRLRIADGEIACATDIPRWTEEEILALHQPPAITARVPEVGDWDYDPRDPRTFDHSNDWMRLKRDPEAAKRGADAARAAIRDPWAPDDDEEQSAPAARAVVRDARDGEGS